MTGRVEGIRAAYHSNREDITPLAAFGTAIGIIIGAAIALIRHFAQTEADRQRRIVETFSKAVEQLGSDKLEVRVGAIFALGRLSGESPSDYWSIMEVLAAFVRDRMRYTTIMARLSERAYFLWLHAGRPEGRSDEFWAEAVRLEGLEGTPTDIDAVFTVIKRRSAKNQRREEDNNWWFDLRGTYLRRVNLEGVYLKDADLTGAHLQGAFLSEAHLGGAILFEAHLDGAGLGGADLKRAELPEAHLAGARLFGAQLERADLAGARLEGAFLWFAYLERADLRGTHLERAELIQAHLEGAWLQLAHLEGADLRDAHLDGADLSGASLAGAHLDAASFIGANLEGADLTGAHLAGATLKSAVGLTDDQLLVAFGDGTTQLPEEITRPNSWPPGSLYNPLQPFRLDQVRTRTPLIRMPR